MGQPGEPYDPNGGYQQPPPGYAPPGGQYPYPSQNPPQYPQPYPAQYPAQPYPAQPYPAQPYPAQPFPPGYAYPYGYPPPPPYGSARPGSVTAAAVLGYVAAGLLFAAALLLFLGASVVDDFDSLTGDSHSLVSAEFVIDGILNLVSGALLIAGGVSFGGRNPNGRVLLSIGGGIVIGESLYWLIRTSGSGGSVFWSLTYAALAIIALSLAWTSAVSAWLRPPTQ